MLHSLHTEIMTVPAGAATKERHSKSQKYTHSYSSYSIQKTSENYVPSGVVGQERNPLSAVTTAKHHSMRLLARFNLAPLLSPYACQNVTNFSHLCDIKKNAATTWQTAEGTGFFPSRAFQQTQGACIGGAFGGRPSSAQIASNIATTPPM